MTGDATTLTAADRNMIHAWTTITESVTGPSGVVERDGLLLLSLGEPAAPFNRAFVLGSSERPSRVVHQVADHYRGLGMPFVLIFRDELVPGLAEACLANGLVERWQPPLMMLDPIPPRPPVASPGPEVVLLRSDNLDAYVGVLSDGFGIPQDMAARVFADWLLSTDGFAGFLGLSDGVPVATSGLFMTGGLAGIYNVATVTAHRGKGIGAAMTWAAASLGRENGAAISVLQSSQAGEPVYRRMGYETASHYRQFEPPFTTNASTSR